VRGLVYHIISSAFIGAGAARERYVAYGGRKMQAIHSHYRFAGIIEVGKDG
jgi:hypothetical protein